MSQRTKKTLKAILVLGFLIAFFYYVPIGDIYRAILSANLFLFCLAVFLGVPGMFLSTLSTWLLARRQQILISLWDFFLFNLSIRFYSFFSPASAVSTAMRWHKLSAGDKGAEALSAIALTRVLSIFVAVSMGLFWALSNINQKLISPFVFILLFASIIIGWLIFTRLSPILANAFHRWSQKTVHPWTKRIGEFLERFFASTEEYAKMQSLELSIIAIINLGNEFLGLLAYILIARALGIPLSFVDLGWLRAISFLAALAPFTLAGGVGLREVTVILTMSAFNINPDLAAAYSFLIYARSVAFALLCGTIELGLLLRPR